MVHSAVAGQLSAPIMRTISALVAILVGTALANLDAQQVYRRVSQEGFATRTELESLAAAADRAVATGTATGEARTSKEATSFAVRQRLREGDFQPGDRIAIVLDGAVKFGDTVIVRSGRTIILPDLPEITLAGVLRSELQSYLTAQLGRYIRDPQLHARPLIRIAVSGAVGRPGFYSVPADALLSDVVTIAGGPVGRAEFARSFIRRGSEQLWNGKNVDTALGEGMTVDALLLQSGDEIVIGEQRQFNWLAVVQGLATVGGIASLILTLGRRR